VSYGLCHGEDQRFRGTGSPRAGTCAILNGVIESRHSRLATGLASASVYLLGPIVIGVALGIATAVGLWTPDFVGNLIATFVGVLGGALVALWFANRDERAKTSAAAGRRRLVLCLVQRELADNRHELLTERAARPRPVIVPFLRRETWRAFADGGELRVVDDPDLLARIANAYFRIETTRWLEEKRYEARGHEHTRILLDDQDEKTIAAINHALAGLNATLGTHIPVDGHTVESTESRSAPCS
jgi:hypothetical protein